MWSIKYRVSRRMQIRYVLFIFFFLTSNGGAGRGGGGHETKLKVAHLKTSERR